jgi:ribosome maturation factor RimP
MDNKLDVTLGLYVAVDGSKEYVGVIESFDGESIVLNSEGTARTFNKKQISKINAEFETEIETEPEEENKENENE